VEQGTGTNVLDSPLNALHHFLKELRQCPGAVDLQAGDVITTGTWTDAWPLQAGESWRAEFSAPLGSLNAQMR
jgi:2-oxo-3-hexenedioate decarboxylase